MQAHVQVGPEPASHGHAGAQVPVIAGSGPGAHMPQLHILVAGEPHPGAGAAQLAGQLQGYRQDHVLLQQACRLASPVDAPVTRVDDEHPAGQGPGLEGGSACQRQRRQRPHQQQGLNGQDP